MILKLYIGLLSVYYLVMAKPVEICNVCVYLIYHTELFSDNNNSLIFGLKELLC